MRYRHISFHQSHVLTRLFQSTGSSIIIFWGRVRTQFKHPKTRTPPVRFLFPSDRSFVCVFHSSRGGRLPSHHAAVQRASRSLYEVIIAALTGAWREAHARNAPLVRYGLAFLLEHGFMRTPKGRTCYQCVAPLHFASML